MHRLIAGFFLAFSITAWGVPQQNYKLEQIVQVSDGSLGAKKLYFELECNQRFLQVLTEPTGTQSNKVGILTEFAPKECDDPSRVTFVRHSSDNRQLIPVTDFAEVWDCTGTCFTPGGPDMPPYNRLVQAYGTSEGQAVSYLGCSPPYLQELSCRELEFVCGN